MHVGIYACLYILDVRIPSDGGGVSANISSGNDRTKLWLLSMLSPSRLETVAGANSYETNLNKRIELR